MLLDPISNEWFTVLIMLCLVILAIAKYLFSRRFNDFVRVIGNSKYLKIYARDQKFIDQFDALLFINLVISFTIFLMLAYSTLVDELVFDITLFVKLFLVIGVLLLIKVLLERLIGSLFDIDELIDSYLFQKTSYRNLIGLILLPINIILIFSVPPTEVLIYIIISLLLLINLIGFLTSFKSHQKLIIANFFYFILYLCALEFAPYIILIEVFNK